VKLCAHCGVVDGTPHDRACPVAESGRVAKALLRRAIGHLRCAEGYARLGQWAAMRGAISQAAAAEREACDVADEDEGMMGT
jgi:hypothetical protein